MFLFVGRVYRLLVLYDWGGAVMSYKGLEDMDVFAGELEKLALDPNTPVDVLWQLAVCPSSFIRCLVAWNSGASVEILEKLSGDEVAGIRWTVADHPKTPVEILEKLSDDKDVGVRGAAVKRLGAGNPIEIIKKLNMDEVKSVRDKNAF